MGSRLHRVKSGHRAAIVEGASRRPSEPRHVSRTVSASTDVRAEHNRDFCGTVNGAHERRGRFLFCEWRFYGWRVYFAW